MLSTSVLDVISMDEHHCCAILLEWSSFLLYHIFRSLPVILTPKGRLSSSMKTVKKTPKTAEANFKDKMAAECWNYIKTVVDIVREPILVLDKDLNVLKANEPFYRMFQVELKDTEGTLVYNLGNGQWDIPALRKLLENILPKNTFFKDFEVIHEFPFIGQKSMILNARQIHSNNGNSSLLPPIIFLAIEDVTPMVAIAETLALHVKELAAKNLFRTQALEGHVEKLEKEIRGYKKTPFKF